MYGDQALSNHGVVCEPQLREMDGDDISHDPLHYFTEVTRTLECLEIGNQFTQFKQLEDGGMYLSIPNKIIKKQDGRTFIHTRIYHELIAKKQAYLASLADVNANAG